MRVAYVYFFIMYAMCPLHYFLKARYDLLVPLFVVRVHLYSRGSEMSEKSPTCIT